MNSNHKLTTIDISNYPEYINMASAWFSEKWGIEAALYKESMENSLIAHSKIPKWYVLIDSNQTIIGGIGIIANDFHSRRDLTPNICALYVEKTYRHEGIATYLLKLTCGYLSEKHFDAVYLITDLINFYDKIGWKFIEEIQDDDGEWVRAYCCNLHKLR